MLPREPVHLGDDLVDEVRRVDVLLQPFDRRGRTRAANSAFISRVKGITVTPLSFAISMFLASAARDSLRL